MTIFKNHTCALWCSLLSLLLFSTNIQATPKQAAHVSIAITPEQQALEHAMADLAKRSKVMLESAQLSYFEQLSDNKGNTLSRYYDANLPPGERWQNLEVIGKDISQSQLQIDIPLLLSPSLLTQGTPAFHGESEKFWIFSIASSVNAESEDEQSSDLEEATHKLQNNLNSFIYIDKQAQQFTRLKIVNANPFKPSTLAKIETFSVIVDYAEAWQTGPFVAVQSIRRLKGSYGLFIGIDEQQTQQLSQYSIN